MTYIEFSEKLQEIRPGAIWALTGNEYTGLVWLDNVQPKPTREELGL